MPVTQLDPDVEAQLRAADLNYDPVGRTSGVLPDDYGHLSRRMILGLGMARFGLDPVPWTPRKRGCSSWDAHDGGLLLSTKTKP